MRVQFGLLGPLEVTRDGHDLTPRAPKLRAVLSLLVLRRNRLVQTDELVDELWGQCPPRSALTTLQTYIYKLRKLLAHNGADEDEGVLHTRPNGYVATIPDTNLDLHRFEQLAAEGREALAAGQPERASRACTQALALWRGPALAGIRGGELLTAHAIRLEETRLRTLEDRIEADLELGRHQQLISELKELTRTHTVHEGFHRQLMIALHRSDRRCEALAEFQRLRRLMIDELGLEPSTRLQQLHRSLLADPEICDPPVQAPTSEPRRAIATVTRPEFGPPAQLPPDTADFVGRTDQLRRAEEWLLSGDHGPDRSLRVLLVTGMPGVGKSALALRLAHRIADRFPDGQLYADLRGSSESPCDPGEILGRFLRSVGVPGHQLPEDLDERATLARTWSAHRKVLLVLDDAATAAQVWPLLPGGSGCAVIVTSRHHLTGLPGARTVELDVLDTADAVQLLLSAGEDAGLRVNRAGAERIVQLCGNLPLAVRCAAGHMAHSNERRVTELLERLHQGQARLDDLRFGELDVRERFDTSYRALAPDERTTLHALGALHRFAVTPHLLDSVLHYGVSSCETLLGRLVERSLLRADHGAEQTEFDEPQYSCHPLIRVYARERRTDTELLASLPAARRFETTVFGVSEAFPLPRAVG